MRRMTQLTVTGFKSIANQTLDLGRLNVLIGGNGVGKSNLISVFKLLRDMYDGNLQVAVAKAGGANALLHFGRKKTARIGLKVVFAEETGPHRNAYRAYLSPTDEDSFIFAIESAGFHDAGRYSTPYWEEFGSGHAEAKLPRQKGKIVAWVQEDLASYRVYHFHDTSETAAVKQSCDVGDNRFLQARAENLAAFLLWMKGKHPDHLEAIQDTVRLMAPFFDRFELAPLRNNQDKIRLEWRERGSESYFNANQLSDGTLRFICLATLLLQPSVPRLVLLDEPELGLHPAAIQLLADLLKQASIRTQLLVSTQSVTLVNHLEPESVWVADRHDGATEFRHLAKQDLTEWIGAYALGELWEKNVLGGRP
jgi:predicted ATPase